MSRHWTKTCEQVLGEVENKYEIGWAAEATFSLLTLFIEQVSTPKQFRDFLEAEAETELEASEESLIVLVGDPPFPAKDVGGHLVAKLDHVWRSVRRWADRNGKKYVPSYGVEGVAPA